MTIINCEMTGTLPMLGSTMLAMDKPMAAAMLWPPTTTDVPVISQLMIVMSTLIFVGFGGHAILLGMISESFHSLPIGTSIRKAATP